MSNTQVIFKPGGLIALAVLCGAAVTAGVITIRGRTAYKAAAPAVGAAPRAKMVIDPGMSEGEIRDKELLVSLNAAPGQARDWLFLGPLPSGHAIKNVANNADDEATMRAIIGTSYLPTEAKYQAHENVAVTVKGATYRWKKVKGSGFDFKQMYVSPKTPLNALNNMVVYGYTTVQSKAASRKQLRFRSDDGAIVWVNGKQVYFGNKIRGVDTEDIIPLELRPGRNNVLVKVGQGSGGWGMSFHLEEVPGKK